MESDDQKNLRGLRAAIDGDLGTLDELAGVKPVKDPESWKLRRAAAIERIDRAALPAGRSGVIRVHITPEALPLLFQEREEPLRCRRGIPDDAQLMRVEQLLADELAGELAEGADGAGRVLFVFSTASFSGTRDFELAFELVRAGG